MFTVRTPGPLERARREQWRGPGRLPRVQIAKPLQVGAVSQAGRHEAQAAAGGIVSRGSLEAVGQQVFCVWPTRADVGAIRDRAASPSRASLQRARARRTAGACLCELPRGRERLATDGSNVYQVSVGKGKRPPVTCNRDERPGQVSCVNQPNRPAAYFRTARPFGLIGGQNETRPR
jgi:hypothetical protein